MKSLRTRPSQGARRQKTTKPPQKLAKAPSGASSGTSSGAKRSISTARKSRVDDKLKKRMSMRYADISGPTFADGNIPAVPTIPLGRYNSGRGGTSTGADDDEGVRDLKDAEEVKEEVRRADLTAMENEEFDPDSFLRSKMASSTEAEIRSLQSSLQGLKDETRTDLQRTVFQNYAEFMVISKEVSTLENDMLDLKQSLSEWKSMPSLLHIDDSASLADRRRTQRSSVADLRVLYASQMQTLHAQIEGSSKFAPATPGRHIVTEMEGISLLNSATYKVEHSVKFVLLDDAVLVARKRARRTADRPGLVAERCWPLNDILVLDTKDSATMTNVFKIRHNKETHVFRTDLVGDKKALLSQFRLVAEELAARRRKEREGEHERRKSMWMGGGDRRSFALDMDMSTLPEWMADMGLKDGIGGAKEKNDKDAIWVTELTDSLTVAIALREWTRAVELVEEGEAKMSTTSLLEPKLSVLRSSLTSSLLHALADESNRKSIVMELTGLLQRLRAGPAARSAFLAARSQLTRKRIRMIRFEGHIKMYISDLATVVFTGIKHTADWFLASFKENDATSSFVEWAKIQIEQFAEMFRKQVFNSDVDKQTIEDCIKITQNSSKKLMQDYGIDFRFLFDALLVPDPSMTSIKLDSISMSMTPASQIKATFSTASAESVLTASTPPTPTSAMFRPPPSPAPPPRSRDRPSSAIGARPLIQQPIKREGMF
ncbi:hypothetical protein SCHPADRAFT_816745 [Schizopora paradoxa]|uniref:Exocyst complex component EXO84 n=1 Tax=Schizopora paradoxa TaxID=27342 RepID=A0A0H2SEK0_9AGAM|nr:hypothetical protein SCHPADRAFT_816745 [Schizopora paradoxa]